MPAPHLRGGEKRALYLFRFSNSFLQVCFFPLNKRKFVKMLLLQYILPRERAFFDAPVFWRYVLRCCASEIWGGREERRAPPFMVHFIPEMRMRRRCCKKAEKMLFTDQLLKEAKEGENCCDPMWLLLITFPKFWARHDSVWWTFLRWHHHPTIILGTKKMGTSGKQNFLEKKKSLRISSHFRRGYKNKAIFFFCLLKISPFFLIFLSGMGCCCCCRDGEGKKNLSFYDFFPTVCR